MTLDEAINHCAEKAADLGEAGCYNCARDHAQLALWLTDYRRLSNKVKNIGNEIKHMSHWISPDGQDLVMALDVMEYLNGR